MGPDGTLITDLEQPRPSSDDRGRDQESLEDGAQLAALPDSRPLVVAAPPAGERIEVDLNATPQIRIAVSLVGAQVDVSGGKIIVTLADGGVIVLQGDLVQRFLAGGEGGIEQFLATAAGDVGTTEFGSPATPDDHTGSGFRGGEVAPDEVGSLNAAGALGATELGYGTPVRGETLRNQVGGGTPDAAVHTPPEADADRVIDVLEDSGSTALGINAPVDADGDALSITVTSTPDPTIGTVYLPDGTTAVTNGLALTSAELAGLTFRPAADANGAAGTFGYTVSDGNGGSDSQAVTLNVIPVNDAPTAGDDGIATNEDTAVTIPVVALLANDTDIDGDALTITSVQGAVNGSVSLVGGDVVFTPAVNYAGPASFTYTVSDGNGGTSTAAVNVTVNPVNDAPVANADAVSTNEDAAVTIPVATLLANDSDIDGDTLTITSVQGAVNGSVSLVGGDVVFTPAANYSRSGQLHLHRLRRQRRHQHGDGQCHGQPGQRRPGRGQRRGLDQRGLRAHHPGRDAAGE